jgi:hypothetical protein
MYGKLNSSIVVHRLAADLGLPTLADPVESILSFCHWKVKHFLAEFAVCASPAELLRIVADKLGTRICEIHSIAALLGLQHEYLGRGELGFVNLVEELNSPDTFGITYRLIKPLAIWEPPFVSVVDCRGEKKQRIYHTKWHEVAHLLVLTDQTRSALRRTHDPGLMKSAEETLVDLIAGEFSFYPELVMPRIHGEISFERIDEIRVAVCPEASVYSSILNLAKLWPTPCVWLEAKLGYKKGQLHGVQACFSFDAEAEEPAPLRAVHVNANAEARRLRIGIIPNFRVPAESIIFRVFYGCSDFGDAEENLSMWTSSNGKCLQNCPVRVRAKRLGDSVHVLVTPLADKLI